MDKKISTEIAISALPSELTEIAKTSGMELTEAQSIGSAFAPFMSRVNEITQLINEIPTENPTVEQAALARKLRLELVSNRGKNGLLETHKVVKEASLVRGRLIDNYKNVVEDSSKIAELRAEGIERHSENQERIRLDEVERIRLERLTSIETQPKYGVNIRLMDDETFEGYFNNEKLIQDAVKRDELARIEADKKAASLVKDRTKLLVDAGAKFDGEIFSCGTINLKVEALSQMADNLFDTNVKNVKSEVNRLNKIQADKDAELLRLQKVEDDRKALLLSRFNTRSVELTKSGFKFDTIAKMFKSDEHTAIPSSTIVNMEDKPWKEYLKSVLDQVEAYRSQVKITNELTVLAIDELKKLGFTSCDSGMENKEIGSFIGARHYSEFRNETELNAFTSEEKLRHAKSVESKKDAETAKLLQAEKDKTHAIELEKQRKAAALLKGPDKDQVREFYKTFVDFKFPTLKSTEGKAMEAIVNAELAKLKTLIINEAKKLV